MATQKNQNPRHLGRGLQSLLSPIIPEVSEPQQTIPITAIEAISSVDKDLQNLAKQIKIDLISPNPYQPRIVWDEKGLEDLAESIKANGVIQPVIVRPAGDGFELIAGERRLRAARLAGLKTIPAVIRSATDSQTRRKQVCNSQLYAPARAALRGAPDAY